jgi:hypothetical protein
LIGLLAGLFAALAIAAWWAAGALRLRRALQGDGGGAVAELSVALRHLGHRVEPSTTLTQLGEHLHGCGDGAAHYVTLLQDLRYGSGTRVHPTPADRRRLRRALAGGNPMRRLRALLALPPGAARRR